MLLKPSFADKHNILLSKNARNRMKTVYFFFIEPPIFIVFLNTICVPNASDLVQL